MERQGRVEVIAGPMFAGKTEELLRRVRRAAIAGQRVVVFSHSLDTRAGGHRIASHAGLDAPSRVVGAAEEIATVVGADEYDTVAPDVAFVRVPKQKSRRHKVTFMFVANEAVTFTCKVDRKKAKPCSSPLKVKMKRYGKHRITVTARDLVGNVDPTPATYRWKLKHKHKKKHHHNHH